MKKRLLIIDDEISILKALERFLSGKGFEVRLASSEYQALDALADFVPDLALIDLKIGSCNGLSLLENILRCDSRVACIIMTGFGSIESAVQAVKLGAFHYLTKPFDLEAVYHLIQKALEHQEARHENQILKKQVYDRYGFENVVGNSPAMASIFQLVRRVADTDSTVLIQGESGTGKELVARALHYNSQRAHRILLPIHCGAIPEDLLESELFGYVRGAFTGAIQNRKGCFEMAEGGTLFLDEIGDMSPKLQVKLLRVLQERCFDPVGSHRSVPVNVRIIAATHKNLAAEVKAGNFREDLFYRLNVIPITVPPLRERCEDIPMLIRFFLHKFSRIHEVAIPDLTASAEKILCQQIWPGNVRELENFIERLVILHPGDLIGPEVLEDKGVGNLEEKAANIFEESLGFKNLVGRYEEELILKALQQAEGNKNKAATLLKLNRTTLVEKMKKRHMSVGVSIN